MALRSFQATPPLQVESQSLRLKCVEKCRRYVSGKYDPTHVTAKVNTNFKVMSEECWCKCRQGPWRVYLQAHMRTQRSLHPLLYFEIPV